MFSILIRPLAACPDRFPAVSGGWSTYDSRTGLTLRKLVQRVLMIDRRGTQ
jgi:hypothetical protein